MSLDSPPMRFIQPSIENVFLFWGGGFKEKLGQINLALRSLSVHNPDKRIYLFTNDLSGYDLGKEVSHIASIVPWRADELVRETPFSGRAHEICPSFFKKRGARMNQWMVFSDFFRYIVLWRWGGTYLDLDDVSVRPLTQQTNVVSCCIACSESNEEGYGQLARDQSSGDRYLRLFNDPLIRFEPGHPFLGQCLEAALAWPPDLAGSRVMTEIYGRSEVSSTLTVRPTTDVLVHPHQSVVAYVSRHCGWEQKWWWSQLTEEEYQARWIRLLRLGRFSLVKNHGWRARLNDAQRKTLSEWVFHFAHDAMEETIIMEHDTRVTVVIPTHRQEFLAGALDGLAGQSDRKFEVIVVENGFRQSGTEDLVRGYEDKMSIRYVYEERLGLNVARNVGCGLARGSILALLDDDCVPCPHWIAFIRAHFSRNPGAGMIAGRVSLRFKAPKPEWVTGEFRSLLSEIEIPSNDTVNGVNGWIAGANFSFRKKVFDMVGGFDEEVGMVGKSGPQLCHDETEFWRRAQDVGNTEVVYSGDISVEHQIPADRLQVEFFERRKYGQGVSDIAFILDRERHSVSEALEKLENQLYDTGWLGRLTCSNGSVSPEGSDLVVINTIRTRIEYIAGLAAACLEAMPERDELRKAVAKYENKARAAASYLGRNGERAEDRLIDLARLMVDSAARKPANHHRCIKPAVMLGRASFFRTIKRELVSQTAQNAGAFEPTADCRDDQLFAS